MRSLLETLKYHGNQPSHEDVVANWNCLASGREESESRTLLAATRDMELKNRAVLRQMYVMARTCVFYRHFFK